MQVHNFRGRPHRLGQLREVLSELAKPAYRLGRLGQSCEGYDSCLVRPLLTYLLRPWILLYVLFPPQVWSLANLKLQTNLVGHTGYVNTVTASPDGLSPKNSTWLHSANKDVKLPAVLFCLRLPVRQWWQRRNRDAVGPEQGGAPVRA